MKLMLMIVALFVIGCAHKQSYIEGNHITLGAYVPFQEALYGVEILQYTNGAYLSVPTNMPFKFEREYSATNSYFWGMAETREWSKSKVSSRQ